MSGIVGSKLNIKGSGLVAQLGTDGQVLTSAGVGLPVAFEDLAAGISWQAVETGSTMTAVAGEGYPINTTSNACTITLPSSASNGDQIIFTDYARTWGTNGIIIDSNGLNYQGEDDTYTVEYGTDGQSVHIVYSGATKGWIPTIDEAVANVPAKGNENGIFGFGYAGGASGLTNLVSNVGVVASDTAAVASAKWVAAGTQYGGDKGIFGYGYSPALGQTAITNLVSNTGVVASDVTGVGTGRGSLMACSYGDGLGLFCYGVGPVGMSNLISYVGVVGTDVAGVGTARQDGGACEYGGDKGISAFGTTGTRTNLSNLISNVGVISADVTGVGTARDGIAACTYGGDKGIFGYGYATPSNLSMTNLVSNAGVVSTDVSGVGSVRTFLAACEYGTDKALFGFGDPGPTAITNLVSNVGVVSTDTSGVGTARSSLTACSYN